MAQFGSGAMIPTGDWLPPPELFTAVYQCPGITFLDEAGPPTARAHCPHTSSTVLLHSALYSSIHFLGCFLTSFQLRAVTGSLNILIWFDLPTA